MIRDRLRGLLAGGCAALAGCAGAPLTPFTTDTPPLVLAPASLAGVRDERARFREVYCAVLQADRARELPDHRPCSDALTTVGTEPAASGRPVPLAASRAGLVAVVVPGFGYECVEKWLQVSGTVADHVGRQGYGYQMLRVDGLSSSGNNARQIRDAIVARADAAGPRRLVLIGYSKGAPDILEAVVAYPEVRDRVAAVVSAAGAVGGSPLANDAEQWMADLLRHFPDSTCGPGDGGAVQSMRPGVRQAWLAQNPLPRDIRYYSLATYPQPDRVSSLLRSSWRKLGAVDARNDSQVIFYDQVLPGSTLLGYINADHWAIAVPVARSHTTIASTFLQQNGYPREALLESIMRFVEEDLQRQ